jgi:hypothetical protein
LICSLLLSADNDEPIDDNDEDEFGILILNGGR